MLKDELISEISMRRDIPMEQVEEVLEEEEIIIEEEISCKRKKSMIAFIIVLLCMIIAAGVLYILDVKQKIDIENAIRKYIRS